MEEERGIALVRFLHLADVVEIVAADAIDAADWEPRTPADDRQSLCRDGGDVPHAVLPFAGPGQLANPTPSAPRVAQPVMRCSNATQTTYMPTPITPVTIRPAKARGTSKREDATSMR